MTHRHDSSLPPAPGPRRRYPGEFALAFARDPLPLLTRLRAEYGDVVRVPLGEESLHLLTHPDHVRDVLVTRSRSFKKGRALERARILLGDGLLTAEGEFHLRQRRLMQPAFHRARLAAYGQTMVDHAERRSAQWQSGEVFDMHREMMALTLAIVGKTLFDADVEGEAADIGAALSATFTAFNSWAFTPWARIAWRLPLPSSRRFRRARLRLHSTIDRIIAERRATIVDRGDLLSMLLAARDEEGDGDGLTDRQVRDEALTLFLAGHETTANAMTWTWYLLGLHPEVEGRLHEELDTLGTGALSLESMPRLAYTRMVFSEAMRLYPPAWAIGRRALDDFEAGGYLIPAGSLVLLSPYLTQRDARWFADPDRFDPDRWLPDRIAARPKFSFFPFGGGPRLCIGEPFAWMEGVLLVAAIARRWRLRVAGSEVPRTRATITLRPADGIRMIAEARAPRLRPLAVAT